MKFVLPLVALVAIAGCGRDNAAKSTTGGGPAAQSRDADESVAAVAQSTAKPAVFLRFVTQGMPVVGGATQLRLDLTGEPGPVTLRLQGGAATVAPAMASVSIPDNGSSVSQSITVTPQAAGLSEILVRVQPAGDAAQEIVYAVPLLVEGAPSK